MKTSLLFCALLCAGCQTIRPAVKPSPDPLPMHGSPAAYAAQPVAPNTTALEEKLLEQSRLMAALVEQNEALTARLQAIEHPAAPPEAPPAKAVATAVSPPTPVQAPSIPPTAPADLAPPAPASPAIAAPSAPARPTDLSADDLALFLPNADGVIDLTTLDAAPPGSLPNPFAIRAPSARAPHELTLAVQGVFSGPSPCALVNERVVEPGDAIESLKITRIEPNAIFLKGDDFNLKLPFGDKPVRLRF
ncbi:MAG: hypothetical protein EXS38_07935 [Opitutus sp.]|nr:hypothetical protein [Opitutus sp.]